MIAQTYRIIFFDLVALFSYVSSVKVPEASRATEKYLLNEPVHHVSTVQTRACIPYLSCIAVLLAIGDTAINSVMFASRSPTDLDSGKFRRRGCKSRHQGTSDDCSLAVGC